MKKIIFAILFSMSLVAVVSFAADKVEVPASCQHCGMDRTMFSHSRMLIEYDDGTSTGTCSLHCAAVELAIQINKTPKTIKVADYNSRQLIDAEKAVWVIGGNKPGVMTTTAKWAFAVKGDAELFVKTNQGKLATFEEAIKTAYDEMYKDTKMIREKRKMHKMKMMDPKH